jgi:hypothetical protein
MADMGRKPRTETPRFRVGDRVLILPTLRQRWAGQRAVIGSVVESKYSRTLDKYLIRVDGHTSNIEVFDIELKTDQ